TRDIHLYFTNFILTYYLVVQNLLNPHILGRGRISHSQYVYGVVASCLAIRRVGSPIVNAVGGQNHGTYMVGMVYIIGVSQCVGDVCNLSVKCFGLPWIYFLVKLVSIHRIFGRLGL